MRKIANYTLVFWLILTFYPASICFSEEVGVVSEQAVNAVEIDTSMFTPVPEPATILILALGTLLLFIRVGKRKIPH